MSTSNRLPNCSQSCPRSRSHAFTLVELLVVIGIIAVLLSILMPTVVGARAQGERAKCMSNLRSLGIMLQQYATENRNWLVPVGPLTVNPMTGQRKYQTLGTNVAPHLRWPALVFKVKIPLQLPYDAAAFVPNNSDPDYFMRQYSAEPFSPRVLLCPNDFEPYEYHSYVLNQHIVDKEIKAHTKGRFTTFIWAGEKRSNVQDYHMEQEDFDRVVEPVRHGIKYGSNYLFLDGHVENVLPKAAKDALDPWEPPVESPTTPTTPPTP